MIVINVEKHIESAVCEPECPVDAIAPDTDAEKWIALNQMCAEIWPSIAEKSGPPSDVNDWVNKPNKLSLLSENPAVS